MKKLILALMFCMPSFARELHDTTITLRMNGDYETVEIHEQSPETRRILHKLAYNQYLKHNQWACFKAALLACTVTTSITLVAVWYANK